MDRHNHKGASDYDEQNPQIKVDAPVTVGNLPLMDVTVAVMLSGHPMARFNGRYWPREIVESFDVKTGWSWEIDCLNHPLAQGAV